MDKNLLDELEASPQPQRPVFLRLLCILTWVGSLGVIAWNVYRYTVYSAFITSIETAQVHTDSLYNTIKWLLWSAIVDIVASLVCTVGAILMWNRLKAGFFTYVIGEAATIFMSIYVSLVLGTNMRSNLLAFAFLLIPIGFCVMYALNFKHLKRE